MFKSSLVCMLVGVRACGCRTMIRNFKTQARLCEGDYRVRTGVLIINSVGECGMENEGDRGDETKGNVHN